MYRHVNGRMKVVHVAPKKEIASPHWASTVRSCAIPDEPLQNAVGVCTIGEDPRGWVLQAIPRNEVLYWMHLVADPEFHPRQKCIRGMVEALP